VGGGLLPDVFNDFIDDDATRPKTPKHSWPKLISYVRVEDKDGLFLTDQDSDIERYAAKTGLNIVNTEREVSNGRQIIRIGLWKALRQMMCVNCQPRQMPMISEYPYWFEQACMPCTCKNPSPADGLIAGGMGVFCLDPPKGAEFTLSMCLVNKHLYSVENKACMSCCNAKAVEFARKRLLK
jgi:hypothetical protein